MATTGWIQSGSYCLGGHVVSTAWLALLGWTCLLLVSPLPSQVPGEACRPDKGPGEASEAPVVMACPVLSQD